ASPSPAASAAPADQLADLGRHATQALGALQAGDLARAQREYEEFDEGWDRIEDEIKARSPESYRKIEEAMDEVKAALLRSSSPDPDRVTTALQNLSQAIAGALPALR